MKISENVVREGIVRKLSKKFGTAYEYYKEDIPQGFVRPSFSIQRILSTRTDGMKMSKKLFDQYYDFVICYFPTSDLSNTLVEECNDMLDELYELFDYVEIIDVTGEEPNIVTETSKLRVNEKTGEIQDRILRFNMTVKARLEILEEGKHKLDELNLIEKIKEEI